MWTKSSEHVPVGDVSHPIYSESIRGLKFVSATRQTTPLLDMGKMKTPILAFSHLNKSRFIILKYEDICYTAVTLVRLDSSWLLTGEPCFSTQEGGHLRLVIYPSRLWRLQCTSCTDVFINFHSLGSSGLQPYSSWLPEPLLMGIISSERKHFKILLQRLCLLCFFPSILMGTSSRINEM